jgi:hypothetical protein
LVNSIHNLVLIAHTDFLDLPDRLAITSTGMYFGAPEVVENTIDHKTGGQLSGITNTLASFIRWNGYYAGGLDG